MKKLIVLFTAAVCLSSCSTTTSQTKSRSGTNASQTEIVNESLNEWQKGVLEAQGLPTDYDKLDVSQQIAIRRMYEMKKYLDDKYGIEFEYAGYIPAGLMEKEQFFAYPKELGTDGGRNYVTVKTDEKGEFTDDYVSASLRDKFEKMYNDFVQDYFNSDKAVVFISHFECDYEDISEMNDDYYDCKIHGQNQIFISDELCDAEKIKQFTADYYKWLYRKGIYGNARITVIYDRDFDSITLDNYTDFYDDNQMKFDVGLCVDKNLSYTNTSFSLYKMDNDKIVCEREEINLDKYGVNN